MIQGSHASLLSGAEFTLGGKWRWLPWYPVAVMIGITAFLVWLTRDTQTGWLVPLTMSPAFLIAIIIAYDLARVRLWIRADGVTYRGVGYQVQAPWEGVGIGGAGRRPVLILDNPSVSTMGWFGFLFALARGFAPVHGRLAAFWMRSVPLYCFDDGNIGPILRRHAPADRVEQFQHL